MGFIYTIPPTGGWILDDMSQPATFVAGTGIIGPKGEKGDTGDTGATGPQGPQGEAATIAAGTTSTLAPGSQATVVNAGSSSAAVFNFGIPEGEKGDKGDTGDTGATGPQGIPGVVAATAPIQYDAPTQTVSIDPAYKPNPFDQSLNTTDSPSFATITATDGSAVISANPSWQLGITHSFLSFVGKVGALSGFTHTDGTNTISVSKDGITFPDATVQTTAFKPADIAATYYPLTNPSGYVTAATAPVTSVAGKTGAVSLAVADVSGAAPTASPTFTGNPQAPTPATSDNDTSIATTAFVNAYCPAASTTAAGKVELATDAEAVTGTSALLALTPATAEARYLSQTQWVYRSNNFGSATSGAGASAITSTEPVFIAGPTSVTGYALVRAALSSIVRSTTYNTSFPWAKRQVFSWRQASRAAADSNSVYRVTVGKALGTNAGDLAARGIGIKGTAGGVVTLHVHNGTTLTNVASSFTETAGAMFDVTIVSEAGTVTLFINDTQVATTNLGPSTNGIFSYLQAEVENIATLTGSRCQIDVGNFKAVHSI